MNGAPLAARARLIAALVLAAHATPVHAWGGAGHRIIAAAAMARLAGVSPAAAERVTRILAGRSIAYAATWPDTLRGMRRYEHTLAWHFVDIPTDAVGYDPARDCQRRSGPACSVGRELTCGDCVIAAIERCKRDLRDPHPRAQQRREALMFLVHLVGDLHQPLHCAEDHRDRGGNTKHVCFLGQCWSTHGDDAGENKTLHAAWDSYMITHQAMTRRLSEQAYADRIERMIAELSPRALAAREAGTTIAWADESHRHAVADAYVLPARVRRRNPYERASHFYYPLGERYFDHNIGVIEDQMTSAAIRLAKVLRDTLE